MADETVNVNVGTSSNIKSIALDTIGGVSYPLYKQTFSEDGATPVHVSKTAPLPVTDYWLQHAIQIIESQYGDVVSVEAKLKDLTKFGHNTQVGTSETTIAHMMPGILHETYLTSNLITQAVSSSPLDTQEIVIEGHTTNDGGATFNFVSQSVTLTGQTPVLLTTPLARSTRDYNNNGIELVGTVYVGETDTYTAGVPDTPSKNHLMITAGEQQSEKCATTISNTDYWIVTGVQANFLKKQVGYAEVDLQIRYPGGVFRTQELMSCNSGSRGQIDFKPYFIIPKNSDVRLTATADAAGTSISGSIQGVLAKVIG